MTNLPARVRRSPLLLALLSLGIMPKPAMRPVRIPTTLPACSLDEVDGSFAITTTRLTVAAKVPDVDNARLRR